MNRERPQPNREMSENQFLFLMNHLLENCEGEEEVLAFVEQLMADNNRYQDLGFCIRYFREGSHIWIDAKPKGDIGYKRNK